MARVRRQLRCLRVGHKWRLRLDERESCCRCGKLRAPALELSDAA